MSSPAVICSATVGVPRCSASAVLGAPNGRAGAVGEGQRHNDLARLGAVENIG